MKYKYNHIFTYNFKKQEQTGNHSNIHKGMVELIMLYTWFGFNVTI